MRFLIHCPGEKDINVKLSGISSTQPSLNREWGDLPVGGIEEPDIYEFPLTKNRERSSIILTFLPSLLLPSLPFCLLPLPQAKHYSSSLLPICLWLKQNFSIVMVHLRFEAGGLGFPLLHATITKPVLYLGGYVSAHNWLESTGGKHQQLGLP